MASTVEVAKETKNLRAKYVRYKDGPEIYGLCQKTFEKLAKDAGAVRKYGKAVLVKCEKIDDFLDLCQE